MAGEDELNVVPIREDIYSKAPETAVHPSQIASPYNFLADAMNKGAEALDKIGETAGERAGYQAARNANIGPDGAIQIDKAPMFGKALDSYSRAVKMGALAEAEGAVRREEIRVRPQFRDNPEGYADYITQYGKKMEEQYSKAAGGDVGFAVRKSIEDTGTRVYRSLQNEKEALDLQRVNKDIADQIKSHTDDLLTKVRGGITDPKELSKDFDAIRQLQTDRVHNPRLGYSEVQAQYEMDHLAGEVGANRFLYEVDQVYKNPDPEKGGAKHALERADSILTDSSLKLNEAERYKYYSRAKSEIHVNEAIRKGDLNDIRAAAMEYTQRVTMMGERADPAEVERLAAAGDSAGAPSIRSHLYAALMRHPLNDGWADKPLNQQLDDIQSGAPSTTVTPGQGVSGNLLQHVKNWEGFAERPKFDYRGYSVGYGSPGKEGGPATTKEEASAVLSQRLAGARRIVEGNVPANTPGPIKDALTSLTNNAGTAWIHAGLGDAVRSGDYKEAKIRFLQYINAKDERTGVTEQPKGLIGRRREEASWFDEGSTGPTGEARETGAHTQQGLEDKPVSATEPVTSRKVAGRTEASPDYLFENRRWTVNNEARAIWGDIHKNWEEKEVFPNPETIQTVQRAALVSGDHGLQLGIAKDLDVMQQVRDLRAMPLPAQEAKINEIKAGASFGNYDELHRAALIKHATSTMSNIDTGVKTDAPGTAAIMFPNKLQVPTALDLDNPEKTIAGMKLREQNTIVAQQTWQTGPYSALGKQDLEAIQTKLENTLDPQVKKQIFGSITMGITDPKIRNATLAAIGNKNAALSAEAWASGLTGKDSPIGDSIFSGAAKLKADPKLMPYKAGVTGEDKLEVWNQNINAKIPANMFSEADRADPKGKWATFKKAIEYRYADLADLDNHDVSGTFNSSRFDRATDDVTGGILEHGNWKIIAPERGMTQTQFDSKLWGVTPKDLEGVTTMNGKPVTVDELRNSAHLESSSEGQYRVLLGKSTDYGTQQPIYAVKDGKAFNLDMRNRPDYVAPDAKSYTAPEIQPFAGADQAMQTNPRGRQYPRGEFEERWWEPQRLEENGIVDKLQAAGVVPGEVETRGEPKGGPHGPRTKTIVKLTPDEEKSATNFNDRGDHEGIVSDMAKHLGIHDIKEPAVSNVVSRMKSMVKEYYEGQSKLKLPDLPQE